MELVVAGIGSWCERFRTWAALRHHFCGSQPASVRDVVPGPVGGCIPLRDRRRAPLQVRIAAEAASQAVSASGLDPTKLPSVFASAMGDGQTTDNICRGLAAPEKIVSPTHFHNSVHNAAAGYWSIAASCPAQSNSVSGFQRSAGVALLEAAALCQTERSPVLLVVGDVEVRPPLDAICPITGSFAAAMVLCPGEDAGEARLRFELEASIPGDGSESRHALELGVDGNPAAGILELLALIARGAPGRIGLDLSSGTRLVVSVL